MMRLFLVLAASVLAGTAFAGEIADAYTSAHQRFLRGDYARASAEFEYLLTLGTMDPLPTMNLALMQRELGDPQAAAAQWLKASLLRSDDPFVWNQRAWNYLALSRFREARDSFKKAVSTSTDSVHAAEAYFGLGLTDSIDGNNKAAIVSLKMALQLGNPYIRPAIAAEYGRVSIRMRDQPKSLPFLTASLSEDPRQPEIARLLGEVYEDMNQAKAAWQAYKFVLDLSPNDSLAKTHKDKMEKYIEGDPLAALPLVRLARPMMRNPEAAAVQEAGKDPIRIALFAGPDRNPRHLTKFYVMGSSTTRLFDLKLNEEIATADNFTQWEIVYRPDNRVLEVRDTAGRVIYVTKQPFQLAAMVPGHTILLKNPEVTDIQGIDPSDREIRGIVEIIPTPLGFHVVNELPMEQYLFSVIGQSLPRDELRKSRKIPLEAYKALAVLYRTQTRGIMASAPVNPERTHTCDSGACLPYKGLTKERKRATSAVRATRGMTVVFPKGMRNEHHLACGWKTATGVLDSPVPTLGLRHPLDLEKLTHEYPNPTQFSEQSADVPQIWNRWLRVLDAEELRSNLERTASVGPITKISVLSRDATGRVQGLAVEGARGRTLVQGEDAIRAFLSPGSLRSTLFTLDPIYRGNRLQRLLVWGAGTGHGRGLCIAGTLGQAHTSYKFTHILRHYFPGVQFDGVPAQLLAVPPPVRAVKVSESDPRVIRRPPREKKKRPAIRTTTDTTLRYGDKQRPARKRRVRPSPPPSAD